MDAGNVVINLSINAANYSQGITKARKQLDQLAGGAEGAGKRTVSSMQATSAALRALHGGFEYNIRAVERWVSQSKVASNIAKTMFPVVGAVTFAYMIGQVVKQVYDFIEAAEQAPAAIKEAFAKLHSESVTTLDELRLTDDELQNQINKLEGKPQNNIAIALDEARKNADALAKSLSNDSDQLDALMKKDHVGFFSQAFLNKKSTDTVEGTISYLEGELKDLGRQYQDHMQAGDTTGAAQIKGQIQAKQNYALDWISKNRPYVNPKDPYSYTSEQVAGVVNELEGFKKHILDNQALQAERDRNAKLVPDLKQAQAGHSGAENAERKAAAARTKAAEEERQAWEANAKVIQGIADAYGKFDKGYLQDHMGVFTKATDLSKMHISKDAKAYGEWFSNLSKITDASRQNKDTQAEATIKSKEATGQITKLSAAYQMATLHTQQYEDAIESLARRQEALDNNKSLTVAERGAQQSALDLYKTQLDGSRAVQYAEDMAPFSSSSAGVGAVDALNEFVDATRDAAKTMRDIVTNTLNGANQQIVTAMTGGKTSWGKFGEGFTRNIAGTALQKAEGTALGALGFGGKPDGTSQGKALWVRMAGSVGSSIHGLFGKSNSTTPSAVSGLFGSKYGSHGMFGADGLFSKGVDGLFGKGNFLGSGGFFSSLFSKLPHFASGGPISSNTLAMVGENGPELLQMGSSSGHIIPNNKINGYMGNGGQTVNYTIDARGTDPALTEARTRAAIMQSHKSAVHQSLQQQHQRTMRSPMRG